MKKVSIAACALALVALCACHKANEVPQHMQGTYKLIQLLGSNNTITVTAKNIHVADCNVNCGDADIALTTVTCDSGGESCQFTAAKCTGSIEKGNGDTDLTIRATPVNPNTDFATCNNISGTMGPNT